MGDKRNKNLLSAAQKIINGQTNGTGMAQTAHGTALGSGITTPKNLNATTDYAALADKYMRDYDNSKFSYDFNTDPVYQAAKQAYINQGKIAAKNVAAQAAKFTGGYGNSYGTMAAQQQYNAALQNANDIIPELQNAAYSRYQNDLAKKQNLANWYLQNSRYQKEDERYADELAYSRDRDRISDERYADELAYSRERDKVSDTRYADELAYSRGRDKISDERYADETKYNRKTAEKNSALQKAQLAASLGDFSLLRQLGYDTTNAEKEYAAKLASSSGSGSSRRSGGSSSKSSQMTLTQYENIRKKASEMDDDELEKYLNGLVNNGYLGSDVADSLWEEFAKFPYGSVLDMRDALREENGLAPSERYNSSTRSIKKTNRKIKHRYAGNQE